MIRVGAKDKRARATRRIKELFMEVERLKMFGPLLRDYETHLNNQNYLATLVEAVHYILSMLEHEGERDDQSGKSGKKTGAKGSSTGKSGVYLTSLTAPRKKRKKKPTDESKESKASKEGAEGAGNAQELENPETSEANENVRQQAGGERKDTEKQGQQDGEEEEEYRLEGSSSVDQASSAQQRREGESTAEGAPSSAAKPASDKREGSDENQQGSSSSGVDQRGESSDAASGGEGQTVEQPKSSEQPQDRRSGRSEGQKEQKASGRREDMSLSQVLEDSVNAFPPREESEPPREGGELPPEGDWGPGQEIAPEEYALEQMHMAGSASEYTERKKKRVNLDTFVTQEFVNNKVINKYMLLLARYKTNSEKMNSYVLHFFMRVKSLKLEPFFYELSTFSIFEKILSDRSIQKVKEFEPLTRFCRSIWRSFQRRLKSNPLLVAEALFSKPRGLVDDLREDPIEKAEQQRKLAEQYEKRGGVDEDGYRDAYLEDLEVNPDDKGLGAANMSDGDYNGEAEYNPSSLPWTADDDDMVKLKFEEHKGDPYMIASSLQNRSSEEVQKRLKRLGLVKKSGRRATRGRKRRSTAPDDDEDEAEAEYEGPGLSRKRRKRLKRGAGGRRRGADDDSVPDRRFDPSDPATKLRIRNTVRLMKNAGDRADTYAEALQFLLEHVKLCQDVGTEFSSENETGESEQKSLRSALVEQDFAIIPFLQNEFAFLLLPRMGELMRALSFRKPAAENGEMYWRIPHEIPSAHLAKMCALVEAALAHDDASINAAAEESQEMMALRDGEPDIDMTTDEQPKPKKGRKRLKSLKSKKKRKKNALEDDDDDDDSESNRNENEKMGKQFSSDEEFDAEWQPAALSSSRKSKADSASSSTASAALSADTYVPSFIAKKSKRLRTQAANDENDRSSSAKSAKPRKRLKKNRAIMSDSDDDSDDELLLSSSCASKPQKPSATTASAAASSSSSSQGASFDVSDLLDDAKADAAARRQAVGRENAKSKSAQSLESNVPMSDVLAGLDSERDASASPTQSLSHSDKENHVPNSAHGTQSAPETCNTQAALEAPPGHKAPSLAVSQNESAGASFPTPDDVLPYKPKASLPLLPPASSPVDASSKLSHTAASPRCLSQAQTPATGPLGSLSLSASSQSVSKAQPAESEVQRFDSLEVNLSMTDEQDDSDDGDFQPRSRSKKSRTVLLDMAD